MKVDIKNDDGKMIAAVIQRGEAIIIHGESSIVKEAASLLFKASKKERLTPESDRVEGRLTRFHD
jgi:hypothetical protein